MTATEKIEAAEISSEVRTLNEKVEATSAMMRDAIQRLTEKDAIPPS